MSKLKVSKSICKRLKITSSGKLLRHKASHSHLLEKKTSSCKQKLRKVVSVSTEGSKSFKNKLPYLF